MSDSLKETGRCAAASIIEMVAALECDYDRLEELREERRSHMDMLITGNEQLQWSDTSLAEELAELEEAAGECTSAEDARLRIQEDALSVEVRADWHAVGDIPDVVNGQFVLLLSTGGPASRIRGELSNAEPRRAWLEVQDWGTPWTQYFDISQDTLLAYARVFYFGES
jgi:hypothetical protein